jgi:hypothetical protein
MVDSNAPVFVHDANCTPCYRSCGIDLVSLPSEAAQTTWQILGEPSGIGEPDPSPRGVS